MVVTPVRFLAACPEPVEGGPILTFAKIKMDPGSEHRRDDSVFRLSTHQ